MRSREFISEKAGRRIDPEMLRTLNLAKAMYPMYDQETAFLKYLQHSSLHGDENDAREDSAITKLDKKVADLSNRVSKIEQSNLSEGTHASRLNVKTTTNGPRTFFEGFLSPAADSTPAWIRAVTKTPMVVESTAEITQGDKCYIGHIQAHREGQGYASELVKYIIGFYKEQGINKFYAYINHNNVNSQNLFRKAGFIEAIKKRDGSFWELNL